MTEARAIYARKIGERIQQKMYAAKYTQKELAEHLGLTRQTIYNYIHGERIPKIDILVRIAKTLDCTVDELVNF